MNAAISQPHGADASAEAIRSAAELTIVVPTFNEAANVRELVSRLYKALPQVAWEVIFVDDDSPDGTAREVQDIARDDPRVRLLHRLHRRGLAGASIEGIMSSTAETVAVMDGDLQHDETLLATMHAEIQSGADLVVGSRYVEGGTSGEGLSAVRSAGSLLATWLSRRLMKAELSDPMSGFFMVRRKVFAETAPRLATDGFKILFDFVCSVSGPIQVKEVPFTFRARQAGESKLDTSVTMDFLGLLLAKLSGNIISVRFFLFLMVGLTGVAVHLVSLRGFMVVAEASFQTAQIGATLIAMTSNFFLNNWLTFRDKRLAGLGLLWGLLSFYAVCSLGLVANVGVATWIYAHDAIWWLAGTAGAIMGAVYNYAAASTITWRK